MSTRHTLPRADGDFVYGEGIDQILMLQQADVLDHDNDQDTSELARHYYHRNALGSVMEITDPLQAVAVSYRYDPYGKATITRGGQVQSSDPLGQHVAFTARWLDEETGLYYYRARMYSVRMGRFLQREPLGFTTGPNLYTYALNLPTGLRDPDGLHFRGDEPPCLHKVILGWTAEWALQKLGQPPAPSDAHCYCWPEHTYTVQRERETGRSATYYSAYMRDWYGAADSVHTWVDTRLRAAYQKLGWWWGVYVRTTIKYVIETVQVTVFRCEPGNVKDCPPFMSVEKVISTSDEMERVVPGMGSYKIRTRAHVDNNRIATPDEIEFQKKQHELPLARRLAGTEDVTYEEPLLLQGPKPMP